VGRKEESVLCCVLKSVRTWQKEWEGLWIGREKGLLQEERMHVGRKGGNWMERRWKVEMLYSTDKIHQLQERAKEGLQPTLEGANLVVKSL